MADATTAGTHDVEERVLLAVHVRLEKVERLAARLALEPELVAARRPEDELALREGLLHRELVRVRDEDDFLRVGILHRNRNDARIARSRTGRARIGNLLADFLKLGEIERELGRFF